MGRRIFTIGRTDSIGHMKEEKERGNRNRATLAVARKMAAYMLAVDKSQKDFIMKSIQAAA